MNPTGADEEAFADLFDELLQQLLDGGEPDLDAVRSQRPALAGRVDEAWSMACAVAGRRQPATPTLGGYEILRELGRGGMGTVYLARHEALGREVALKVLPTSLGLSPRSRRRFLEEARALARLQHDHIVRIHRVVEHGDLLAFEMEYVDGASLRHVLDHLRSVGPGAKLDDLAQLLAVPTSALGARNLLEWFVATGSQIARALHAAHTAGIVHRDVKPANLLLRRDGRPLLADFGLARGDDAGMTHSGAFVGTPTYAPPEQLRAGDEAVDARADVYSLGVTLYEAIALAPPFAGRTTTEMLRSIEEGHAAPLRRRAPHVPRDLETIIGKAMERAPKDRYATAAEFADDLDRLLHLQPIAARPAGPLRRAGKFARRHRRTLLAAGAGALLVGLATLPFFRQLQAAEIARATAAQHLAAARVQVLATAGRADGWHQFPLARGPVHQRGSGEDPAATALQRAAGEYAAAVASGAVSNAVRIEAGVVALAQWLRTSSPTRQEQVASVLAGDSFRDATAGLPPLVQQAARKLAAGEPIGELAGALPGAPVDDRMALGLLGLLVGEFRLCERCWSDFDGAPPDFPLLDAGLGMLFFADGRPERAYVRLIQGTATFPASDDLSLLLADAALAARDPALAAQWLAKVRAPDADAATQRRVVRLRADLAAADGDDVAARAVYQRLADADHGDPLPRYRLAQSFAAAGDLAAARAQLTALLADWPDVARFRLETARVALQLGDARLYLSEARYVLAAGYGTDRGAGAATDLLEILHLGGLDRLAAEGAARNGRLRLQRDALALRRPVQTLLPAPLRPQVEAVLQAVTAIELDGYAEARRNHGRLARAGAAGLSIASHLPAVLLRLPAAVDAALLAAAMLVVGDRGDELEIDAMPLLAGLQLLNVGSQMHVLALGDTDPVRVFGSGFAPAGDADGDGVTDFLVGSTPPASGSSAGVVYVVSGTDGRALTRLTVTTDRLFGYAVATVGDVDGDGIDDWLVGAPQGGRGSTHAGGAYLFSGRDGSLLRRIDGEEPGFGVCVTGVGDWDGDGAADYAIGVPPELRNRTAIGEVRVYSGKNGELLHRFASDRAGVWFGAAIADVGDIDGDGCHDLAIAGNYGDAPGQVCVYSGRTGARLHAWVEDDPAGNFGERVFGAGDVDGDGCADIAVAAPGVVNGARAGRVCLFSGKDGHLLRTVVGEGPADRFGQSLAGGIDLDGDGVPDLLVGAGTGGKSHSGCIALVAGKDGAVTVVASNMTPNSAFATHLAVARSGAATAGAIAVCNADDRGLGSLLLVDLPPWPTAPPGRR